VKRTIGAGALFIVALAFLAGCTTSSTESAQARCPDLHTVIGRTTDATTVSMGQARTWLAQVHRPLLKAWQNARASERLTLCEYDAHLPSGQADSFLCQTFTAGPVSATRVATLVDSAGRSMPVPFSGVAHGTPVTFLDFQTQCNGETTSVP
jgi:hypothetical protein